MVNELCTRVIHAELVEFGDLEADQSLTGVLQQPV